MFLLVLSIDRKTGYDKLVQAPNLCSNFQNSRQLVLNYYPSAARKITNITKTIYEPKTHQLSNS
jgi:hypothetical protein